MKQCFCQCDEIAKNQSCLAYASIVEKKEGHFSRFMHMHHDIVEIILITDGSGEYFIDNTSYVINKGDLVIYNSLVVHDEFLVQQNAIGTLCCGIKNIAKPGLRGNALITDSASPVFHLNQNYDIIYTLMKSIFSMLAQAVNHKDRLAQQLTQVLLEYLNHNILAAGEESHAKNNLLLTARVKTYIDHHFTEQLQLNTLAELFGVSPFYLAHEFKKNYGYSPVAYLIKRRLGEAQTLLTTATNGGLFEKITDIAYLVGFNSLSHFQTSFKTNVGKTPGQYRNEYLKENSAKMLMS